MSSGIGICSFQSSCQPGIGMYLLIAACVVTVVGCCCCCWRAEHDRERMEAAVDSSRDELTGLLRDQARALTRKKKLLEQQEALVMEQSRLVWEQQALRVQQPQAQQLREWVQPPPSWSQRGDYDDPRPEASVPVFKNARRG